MWPAPPQIGFAGGALDRAAHLRDRAAAERLRDAVDSKVVLVGKGQEVATAGEGGGLALVPTSALPADAELTFLGLDTGGTAVFAYDAAAGAPATGQIFEFVPLRSL